MKGRESMRSTTLGHAVAVLSVLFCCAAVSTHADASPPADKLVANLRVSAETPDGYDRDKFNHWTSIPGRGCDTREVVLFRQNIKRPRRCGDERGRWFSAYDGKTVRKASGLDVDHMVPLAEAWDSGARRWSARQREAFANDLYKFSLVAVTLSSNRSKGDRDPADWLPTRRGFGCIYLVRWTAVKYRWRLTVDEREKQAILEQFESSPPKTLRLPTIKRANVPGSQGGGDSDTNDPRFGTCAEATEAGYGPYEEGVDPEYWWYEDRDGDGTVCE